MGRWSVDPRENVGSHTWSQTVAESSESVSQSDLPTWVDVPVAMGMTGIATHVELRDVCRLKTSNWTIPRMVMDVLAAKAVPDWNFMYLPTMGAIMNRQLLRWIEGFLCV
jgi:hypothetical protein